MNENQSFYSEFKAFQNLGPSLPPTELKNKIFQEVHNQLVLDFPKKTIVFSKVILVQLVLGMFTLGICSQFGNGGLWFDVSQHLHHHLPENLCALTCAAIFSLGTFFLVPWLLPLNELHWLRQSSFKIPMMTTAISILTLLFFGKLAGITYILFWMMGSFLVQVINLQAMGLVRLGRQSLI